MRGLVVPRGRAVSRHRRSRLTARGNDESRRGVQLTQSGPLRDTIRNAGPHPVTDRGSRPARPTPPACRRWAPFQGPQAQPDPERDWGRDVWLGASRKVSHPSRSFAHVFEGDGFGVGLTINQLYVPLPGRGPGSRRRRPASDTARRAHAGRRPRRRRPGRGDATREHRRQPPVGLSPRAGRAVGRPPPRRPRPRTRAARRRGSPAGRRRVGSSTATPSSSRTRSR